MKPIMILATALIVANLPAPGGTASAAPQSDAALERLVSQAEQRAREGDQAGAIRDYATLVEQFPSTPEAANALLGMALGYRDLDQVDESEAAARKLLEDFPRAPEAAGAYVVLGEIRLARARRPESLDEARATFANAYLLFDRRNYRELEWRAVGAVRSGEIALLGGELEEAGSLFVEVLDQEPPSVWTDRARLGLSDVLIARGLWREAGEILVSEREPGPEVTEAFLSRRQALIERLWLRPEAGKARWLAARTFAAGEAWKKPRGVAAREDGRVLVTDAGDQATLALAPSGERVARWSHGEPAMPSWDPTGGAVVAKGDGAYHEPGRGRLDFAAAPGDKGTDLEGVMAVEPAAFGQWFVLTGKPARVLLYDRKMSYVRKVMDQASGEPVDIARDRIGRLYVLDRKTGVVHRFTAAGDLAGRLGSGGLRKPVALAIDEAGHVYVLDRDTRSVAILDPNGQKLEALGPVLPGGLELKRPVDVTVDGAGRVYLVEDKPAGIIVVE